MHAYVTTYNTFDLGVSLVACIPFVPRQVIPFTVMLRCPLCHILAAKTLDVIVDARPRDTVPLRAFIRQQAHQLLLLAPGPWHMHKLIEVDKGDPADPVTMPRVICSSSGAVKAIVVRQHLRTVVEGSVCGPIVSNDSRTTKQRAHTFSSCQHVWPLADFWLRYRGWFVGLNPDTCE